MALKPDRVCLDYSIDYFMDKVQERGVCLALETGASGVSNDNVANMATVADDPSGVVALGVLLNDMVDIDLSKYALNRHKDEVQKGGKVTILKKGQVTTDRVVGTPVGGADAYLGVSGLFSPTQDSDAPRVGRFDTAKDENGFAKISVNLP